MSKKTTCKKCGASDLTWCQDFDGRWKLASLDANAVFHFHACPVIEVKTVTCKYCGANDLYWSKEKMEDSTIKNVLMESFGIPHGCDERRVQLDAAKQALKDTYAKEKARLDSIPNGTSCGVCTNGYLSGITYRNSACPVRCTVCGGSGAITDKVKKRMLFQLREKLWPGISIRRKTK